MDALASLLDGPRARGAFLLRVVMEPPWSIRVADRAPLALVAMTRGETWMLPHEGEALRLRAGEVAIIRGPDPYTMADDLATPPQIIVHPGQRCTTIDGTDVRETMGLGVRTWGNSQTGTTTMLVGTYQMGGEVSQRLLSALPVVVSLPGDAPLMRLLDSELDREEPGQETVLDRLLDLLLVAFLRAWFSRPDARPPAWYQAHGDPVVGRALRMLYHEPARQWTVAELAAMIGVSRATLARRFTELVGEPPMTFLSNWRLARAADLLRESDATIGAIARQVGYGSSFALSTAFKRVHGVSPQQHRLGGSGLAALPREEPHQRAATSND